MWLVLARIDQHTAYMYLHGNDGTDGLMTVWYGNYNAAYKLLQSFNVKQDAHSSIHVHYNTQNQWLEEWCTHNTTNRCDWKILTTASTLRDRQTDISLTFTSSSASPVRHNRTECCIVPWLPSRMYRISTPCTGNKAQYLVRVVT